MADGFDSATDHVGLARPHRMTLGAIPFAVEQQRYPPGEVVDAPQNYFVLCLLQHGSGEIRFRFDGGRWRQQQFHSGMFAPLTPPLQLGEFWMASAMSHVVVELPTSVFDAWHLTGNVTGAHQISRLHEHGFKCPFLTQIVLAALAETRSGNPNGALFGDALRLALAGAILRAANDAPPDGSSSRRLTSTELRHVRTFLEDRIGEPVLLADMAATVGMSERTFSDAFRLTSGQTPYQFGIVLRIERAKAYLAGSNLSIPEIAVATGFSDQAHFTTTFRRHVGLPPARYRRSAKN